MAIQKVALQKAKDRTEVRDRALMKACKAQIPLNTKNWQKLGLEY